jgi:hypothetical protein
MKINFVAIDCENLVSKAVWPYRRLQTFRTNVWAYLHTEEGKENDGDNFVRNIFNHNDSSS